VISGSLYEINVLIKIHVMNVLIKIYVMKRERYCINGAVEGKNP